MNAHIQASQPWISEEEYLRGELISPIKHEYINGHVYAMAGASKNHERIAGNVFGEIRQFLKGSPCEPFGSDLKVKVGSQFFYPDMMVVCDDPGQNEYYTQSPVLIVEVLSRRTRRTDETTKRLAYLSIPSLLEYVLIEQDVVDVEVCRRSEGWVSSHYFMGDTVPLESIGLSLPVEDIYARVVNEDVRLYFEEQAASNPPSIPASA
jgi:Uma2 family endonuclease